jgi:NADH dehydrogenase [ubiquinone] 1 alpha subcomplex assembly factor 5
MKAISLRPLIAAPFSKPRILGGVRRYAIQTPGAPTVEVFSNRTKWLQKERAAANVELSRKVDYLRDEVAFRLSERLLVGPA